MTKLKRLWLGSHACHRDETDHRQKSDQEGRADEGSPAKIIRYKQEPTVHYTIFCQLCL